MDFLPPTVYRHFLIWLSNGNRTRANENMKLDPRLQAFEIHYSWLEPEEDSASHTTVLVIDYDI